MQSSPFDFDVVTDPPLPAEQARPKPPKNGGEDASPGATETRPGGTARGTAQSAGAAG